MTKRSSTGLLAAAFTAIVPSYISRSVGGSYDNEGVAIFALIFVFYLWIKSVNTGSMMWACLTVSAKGARREDRTKEGGGVTSRTEPKEGRERGAGGNYVLVLCLHGVSIGSPAFLSHVNQTCLNLFSLFPCFRVLLACKCSQRL